MSDEIVSKLQDVFRKVLNQPALELRRDMTAAEVRGWDSLKQIELIVSTEATFGVRFKTAEVGSLKNVGELIDKVKDKLAKR